MSERSEKVIYLFDSASSIRSLGLVDHFANRDGSMDLVAVVDSSIVDEVMLEKYFDRHYVVPAFVQPETPCLMRLSDVVEATAQEFDCRGPVRVVSYGEYTPLVAAGLRERFDVPGPKTDCVVPFRDKLVMKREIGKAVRVPEHEAFDRDAYATTREQYLLDLAERLRFPFVVKPVNAASALGTRVVRGIEDAAKVDDALLEYSGSFGAESYIEGVQYHCEIVYAETVPLVAFVSRFNRPVLALADGYSVGSMPVEVSDPVFSRIVEFCQKALAATPIVDGITHTELFVESDGSLCFLETATRAPGGRVVDAYRVTHGLNLLDIDQRIKAGLPYSLEADPPQGYAFWAVVPTRRGKVSALLSPELESECEIRHNFAVGDELADGKNFETVFATVFVRNSDRAQLQRDFEKIDKAEFFTVA